MGQLATKAVVIDCLNRCPTSAKMEAITSNFIAAGFITATQDKALCCATMASPTRARKTSPGLRRCQLHLRPVNRDEAVMWFCLATKQWAADTQWIFSQKQNDGDGDLKKTLTLLNGIA